MNNIIDLLREIGINDPAALPEKTQRKIKRYNQRVNNTFGNRKDGTFAPGKQQELDDLIEDIIIESKVFLKKNVQQPAKTQEQIEAEQEQERLANEERERQRLADEEKERQRLADEEKEKQRLAEIEAKKNKKGPLEEFLGY